MKKIVRNHEIKVRLSDAELNSLDQKVAASGMKSRERFCRACFRDVTIKGAPPKEFFVLITEVRQIGNNLNQVARRLNSYVQNERPDSAEVTKAIKGVNDTLDLLYSTYTTEDGE